MSAEPDSKALARNIAALVDRYLVTADMDQRNAIVNLTNVLRHMTSLLDDYAKEASDATDALGREMVRCDELAEEIADLRRQLPDYEVTR